MWQERRRPPDTLPCSPDWLVDNQQSARAERGVHQEWENHQKLFVFCMTLLFYVIGWWTITGQAREASYTTYFVHSMQTVAGLNQIVNVSCLVTWLLSPVSTLLCRFPTLASHVLKAWVWMCSSLLFAFHFCLLSSCEFFPTWFVDNVYCQLFEFIVAKIKVSFYLFTIQIYT